jgi:excisionase family DNA binding protein
MDAQGSAQAPITADVYTVPQAGERLGISRDLAYKLAREGRLPVLRLGGRLVVPKARLERLLNDAR